MAEPVGFLLASYSEPAAALYFAFKSFVMIQTNNLKFEIPTDDLMVSVFIQEGQKELNIHQFRKKENYNTFDYSRL